MVANNSCGYNTGVTTVTTWNGLSIGSCMSLRMLFTGEGRMCISRSLSQFWGCAPCDPMFAMRCKCGHGQPSATAAAATSCMKCADTSPHALFSNKNLAR